MVFAQELSSFPNISDSATHSSGEQLRHHSNTPNSTEPSHERKVSTLHHEGHDSKLRINDSARLYTNPLGNIQITDEDHQPLYKTMFGRVEINVVSRYLMGAAFFALGAYALKEWKMGSDAQRWYTQPLETIADAIDWGISNPISNILTKCGMDKDKVEHLMTFNKYVAKSHMVQEALSDPTMLNSKVFGMSLGQAVVDVTLPFAMGSIGAALGRDLALFLDPNHKKEFIHEDGIHYGEMAKAAFDGTCRILFYHQMEDWAVAPIYLVHRRIFNGGLENIGFASVKDLQNSDGNTHFVNKDGQIGGSYELAGWNDLQHRFPLYNFYTLLFRDAHNHIGHSFNDWKDNGFKVDLELPKEPVKDLTHGLDETWKYVAKSFIKSQLYMHPAMLAFTPMNNSINKGTHALMDEETKQYITTTPTYNFNPDLLADWNKPFMQGKLTPNRIGVAARIHNLDPNEKYYAGAIERDLSGLVGHDPYQHNSSPISPIMNPIGRATSSYSNFLYNNISSPIANKLEDWFGIEADHQKVKSVTNDLARAQVAYTGYFIAKYESARVIDTIEMDASIYRMLDGISSLNAKEVGAGLEDIGKSILHQPVSEQTHQLTFEQRGLINSKWEGDRLSSQKQKELAIQAELEKHKDDIQPSTRANNIVSTKLFGKDPIASKSFHELAQELLKEDPPIPANNIVSAKLLGKTNGVSLNDSMLVKN